MTIDTVLFDLDDTLCDYRAARRRAQQKITARLRGHGIHCTEEFWEDFERHDPPLFKRFADGEITKEEYRVGRFSLVVTLHTSEDSDPARIDRIATEANDVYLGSANSDIELFDDALPALAGLNELGTRTALLTNGPADGQRRKIRAVGLDRHIPHIFVSEELGHAKPSPRAFHAVLNSLAGTPDSTLMVGDSLGTDVEGARASGLHALHLDRSRPPDGTPAPETLRSLSELPSRLGAFS